MLTTVVLADDHPVVRQGIKALLERDCGLKLLGEAGNGIDAAAMAERLKPRVLVLDMMMPGLGGAEVTRRVARTSPSTRVLILSMHDDAAYVLEALNAGALGYLLKDCTASELVEAIHAVATGKQFLSPALGPLIHRNLAPLPESVLPDPYDTLTNREREVLHLAVEGCTSAQIAERLSISPRTAETHRTNLMRKLSVRTSAELIRYGIKRGITS